MDAPTLLVDGRNLIYRAIFANKKSLGSGFARYHSFTVMLRFMREWLQNFSPAAVHIFWDARKDTLWRRKIYPEYKVKPENPYFDQVKDDLLLTEAAAKALFRFMGVRQFSKSTMEADDLIYSAAKLLAPAPVIIVSSDHDYEQLVFRHRHIRLYNPMIHHGEFIDPKDYDPAIAKALMGDSTDNVPGYRGIGKVKGANLARSLSERVEFLQASGHQIYLRNLLLVDLSLNPFVLKNDLYVQKVMASEATFDADALRAEAKKHKVSGLIAEYATIVSPFKLVAERAGTTQS